MKKELNKSFTFRLITSLIMSNTMLAGSDPFTIQNEPILEQAESSAIASRPNPIGFYDSTILEYTGSGTVRMGSNVSAGGGFNSMWQEVTFRGIGAMPSMKIIPISLVTFQEDNSLKKLSTGTVNLENIAIDSNIQFFFNQSDNVINFDNAKFDTQDDRALFISTSPMTININSGTDNEWFAWDSRYGANTTLNVNSGTAFNIRYGGFKNNAKNLTFDNDFTVNVDDAKLIIDHTYIKSPNGVYNFTNGAELELIGSNTGIVAKDLHFIDSTLNDSAGAQSIDLTGTLSLENSSLNMIDLAVEVPTFKLKGNTSIDGQGGSTEKIKAQVLQTADASATTLFVNHYNLLSAETLILSNNLTIDVERSFLRIASGGDLVANGGTINLNAGGEFSIFGSVKGNAATINIDGGGIFFGEQSTFELNGPLNVTMNDGSIKVKNIMMGTGTLTATGDSLLTIEGDFDANSQGVLALGSTSDPFGTLTTDATIIFASDLADPRYISTGLINSGIVDGGQFHVDVGLDGGSEKNDKIEFGDGDVNISIIKSINIEVPDGLTANQLDKKEFTIIAAQPGATGDIVFDKTSKTVDDLLVEGGSVPVLIDFRVVDNNTNGKEDITLVAEENLPINLSKHQNVKTRNHRGSASLVGSAAHTGNTQINNALNSLTNQQLTSHLDTIHPEGYSSYMTVGLEASLGVLKTVANNSRGANTFRAPLTAMTASTEASVEPSVETGFEKEFWADLSYVDGNIDEDGELGSIDYSITSFVFGQDLAVDHNSKVGAFAGYSYYKMNEHGVSDMDLDTDVLYLGMYHQYRSTNDWSFDSSIGYAYGMNESERNSTLGTISGTSDGEYDSHSLFIGSTAEKVCYKSKSFSISPEFGMYYVYYYQESFDESGNPSLDLSLESDDAHSLVNSIGLNFDFNSIGTDPEYTILPRLFIRYEHDWIANHDDDHSIHASLKNSNSGSQSFTGQNRGANHVIGGFNINGKINDKWNMNLGSSYSYNDNGDEVGINARISYSF